MAKFQMASTQEKPMRHLTLSDWHSRVNQLRNVATTLQDHAVASRNTGRSMRIETHAECEFNMVESSDLLDARVLELNSWRDIFEKTHERTKVEIERIRDEIAATEAELESMHLPLNVITDCRAIRDCRGASELTYDDADTEIRNELEILETNQKTLSDQIQKAWEKMAHLEELRKQLAMEAENKLEAEQLDTVQHALNKFSGNISLKPKATSRPKKALSYEAWLQHSLCVKQMAENELADALAVRESLFACREKARNLLHVQQDRTDHCIRKRIFETQRARNELQWQQTKMKEEMRKAICEINEMEQALRDKTSYLKLAQTRLQNRKGRGGNELCLDQAYDQLCYEVSKLRDVRESLICKTDEARAAYNMLEAHAHKIDVDLEAKQQSLMADIQAFDTRQRMRPENNTEPSATAQFERNMKLTNLEKEIPKC